MKIPTKLAEACLPQPKRKTPVLTTGLSHTEESLEQLNYLVASVSKAAGRKVSASRVLREMIAAAYEEEEEEEEEIEGDIWID